MCRIMSFHKRVLRSVGKGPVRRNLFGPVDRKQLQQDYHTALKQDLEEASQRWGFNFLTEMPLDDSNFLWEGVSGEKVPLVYRSSRIRRNLGFFREESTLSEASVSMETGSVSAEAAPGMLQSGKENVPGTPEKHTNNLQDLERTPVKQDGNSNILKRKQTNITDFYQAKKRDVGSSRKSGQ
ncbi:cyclin-dependent kinase inhibitor 1 isoform X1 [Clupea harengus]|uniref:Cyclin-dependent kinase inhibitor 1 isoform X1 n=2 Tax=Clupea harengus TaxID=7950 RepID=A0A6P3VSM5_CLUHA|nr:cyclin-dependent kinase inhibitor 1 isoform X1 [Clupea harengus]